jgi:DNA-binding PadR family transcriptional regulator
MHHRMRRHYWRHHARGPWAGRGRLFGPGEVRLALLSLVAERSMHGYELMRELEARSGGTYSASAGTVYPTLQQLEDEGLVEIEHENGKRVYRATAAGRELLAREEATVRGIWRRTEEWSDWGDAFEPGGWEVSRPALRVLKTAFAAIARGADPDQVRAVLERTRAELEELGRRAR